MNPLYLMIPVTFSCCHAFMLPVGTPSNAMVFSAGKMKAGEMVFYYLKQQRAIYSFNTIILAD